MVFRVYDDGLGFRYEFPDQVALKQVRISEELTELLDVVQMRPDISTGGLLELFAEREEAASLQKLAGVSLPGDAASWQAEFDDVLAQLAKQTLQQRIDELMTRMREVGTSGMTPAEKDELRELQTRMRT